MRILLWSVCPWARTAFGENCLNLALRFKEAGHEVAIFAFTGLRFNELEYKGIRIFPNNANDHGETYLPIWCNYYKPDLVIQHFDLYSLNDYLSQVADKLPPIYVYPPIDSDPLPPPLKLAIKGATKVIAMTKFAQAKFKEADIESTYIPHAIDTEVYHPGSRKEARDKMKFPHDHFLFLSVATNKGPRKNLGNVLRAFKDFLNIVPEARKDTYLYFHCYIHRDSKNPHGYELPEIWENLGITNNIMYTHPDFYDIIGYTEEEVADLYRAADWTILCSLGEGFGLSFIEGAACGIPILCPEHGNLKDIWQDKAEYIKIGYQDYIPGTNYIADVICIDDFADKLNKFYENRKFTRMKGEQVFEFSKNPKFDWKVVADKVFNVICRVNENKVSIMTTKNVQ